MCAAQLGGKCVFSGSGASDWAATGPHGLGWGKPGVLPSWEAHVALLVLVHGDWMRLLPPDPQAPVCWDEYRLHVLSSQGAHMVLLVLVHWDE